jgi:hypothetical protein
MEEPVWVIRVICMVYILAFVDIAKATQRKERPVQPICAGKEKFRHEKSSES